MPICHEPGDHPLWQESMAFLFHDERTDVGGTMAFGTFVPAARSLTWAGASAPRWTFQRSLVDLPLVDADRTEAVLGAGGNAGVHYTRTGHGTGRVVVEDPELSVDLALTDLYEPQSWHRGGSPDPLANLGAGHVETSCLATGVVQIAGVTHEIDGVAHRDHSWGPRTLDIVRNHRWVAGTCGPALPFSLEVLHLAAGSISTFGYVMRDGARVEVETVETLVTVDHDGLTPRHFESRVGLEGGDELLVTSERIHAVLYNHRVSLTAIDAPAVITAGGLTGHADLNLIANPLNGSDAPTVLVGGTLVDGLRAS